MHPIILEIGPFKLRAYGVLVACAFLAGLWLARRGAARRRVPESFMLDLAAASILSGIVGARIFYVAQNAAHYAAHPLEVLRIWQGGLVFYGGFLSAAAVAVWFARRRRQPVATVADVAAPALALGQSIGRLGCFLAGCCHGKPTELFCAVPYRSPEALAPLGVPLHPTQLYESAGCFALAALTWWRLRGGRDRAGSVFWMYVLGYGILRFAVEMLRGDVRGAAAAGLFPSQWIALAAVVVAASVLVVQAAERSDGRS